MEKSLKSEWWFLSNINFVTVGISYFIYLIILLVGNFVDVAVSPVAAAIVISLIFLVSNFIASKLAFREGKMEKRVIIKYLVYNLILFLMVSCKFLPLVMTYIGMIVANDLLISVIVAFVAVAINALFVVNMND